MSRMRVCSFLTGVSLGSAIGLLLAPQAGGRTRSQIREAANEGADYLTDGAAQVQNLVEQGKSQLARQKEAVVEGVKRGSEAYKQTLHSAGSTV